MPRVSRLAERARFELANGVRPLRHFQCRALDQTRRPLRSESILSAFLGTASYLAGTDDLPGLAAKPNVHQDEHPHPEGAPCLGVFENRGPVGAFAKSVKQLDSPWREGILGD